MKLYTIGFTKKTAEEFFTLLIENKIRTIIDIRRKNTSQLAGFTKKNDLKSVSYTHLTLPTTPYV